jgi:serine/threonine protein kinase
MMIADDQDKEIFIKEADLWNELSTNDSLKMFLPKLLHTDLKVYSVDGGYIRRYSDGSIGPGVIGFIFQLYEEVESLQSMIIRHVRNDTVALVHPDYGYTLYKNLLKGFDLFHKAGYIHRDIKPGNILVRTDQNNPKFDYPIIIDFGMACKIPCTIDRVSGTFPFLARNYFPGYMRDQLTGKGKTFGVATRKKAPSIVDRLTYYVARKVAGRESRRPVKVTRKQVRVQEIQEQITPEYNIHTDNYALAITIEAFLMAIDFGKEDPRKEEILRKINQLKASLMGDLVAATARRDYGLAQGGRKGKRKTRRSGKN